MNLAGIFKVEDGDVLGPADVIAHKVRDTLAADSKLREIFTPDAIETVDRFRNLDYRDYPRLQVCAFSEEQVWGATNNDSVTSRIYIRVKYQDDGQWQALSCGSSEAIATTVGAGTDREYVQRAMVWPFGMATMATLEWHIFTVLKADAGLMVKFPDASTETLCNLATFGPSSHGDDEPDPETKRFASNHTIQVEYKSNMTHSGPNAGKFSQAANHGG